MNLKNNIDVFISYHSSSSKHVTQAISNCFEQEQIRCWYAPRDVDGVYASEIVRAINACRIFILVLNRQASMSQDVLNELNVAFERLRHGENITIIPFQTSGEIESRDISYYIGRMHWVDAITPPLEERIKELRQRVKMLLGQTVESASVEKRPAFSAAKLKSTSVIPNSNFCGREQELTAICESLEEYNKIIIQGMGGIGKTELAKAYAQRNKSEFHTVILATKETSIRDLILYDKGFAIEGFARRYSQDRELESEKDFYLRKIDYLKEIADEKMLIIVDNFDVVSDEDFEDLEHFLEGPYTMIFTTRVDLSEIGIPILELKEFPNIEDRMELFTRYYKRRLSDEDAKRIHWVLDYVNGHTLAIELIAKLMASGRVSPKQMLEQLTDSGISGLTNGTIANRFGKRQSVYDNVKSLFDMSGLSQAERYVMINLSLLPLSGVPFEVFVSLCDLSDSYDLDLLIKESWVRYCYETDTISLHPLIREVVFQETCVDLDVCGVLIAHVTEKLKQIWSYSKEEKQLYGEIGRSLYERFPKVDETLLELYEWVSAAMTILEQFEVADEIIKKCLKILEERNETNTVQAAQFYYRLGSNVMAKNDNRTAIEYLKRSIAILETAAPNSEKLAYMIKYLCWILLRWDNDYENIEKLLHKSNELLQMQNPVNLVQIASQYSAYANLYYQTGQNEIALEYADKAYDIFYELNGDVHGDTVAPMTIKARILSKMGKDREAVELALYVIEIQKKLNEENHQTVLNRYNQLSEVYENLGRFEEAKEVLNKVMKILREKQDSSPFYYEILEKLERLG